MSTLHSQPLFPFKNRLLSMMSGSDAALLSPLLEPVGLDVNQVLIMPGQPLRHVYFVESGLISIVGANRGGRRIEVGMVGSEGMSSVEAVLGSEVAEYEALVQSAGSALRLAATALREITAQSRSMQNLLLRFVQVFMIQCSHAAISAGRAHIDERLARGLLMWQDRLRSNEWLVTHEFLALLMGVRRQGVTVALHELEGKGLIRSGRNCVRILDRDGLEQAANGFYGVPEEAYRRLIPEDRRGTELSSAA